MGAEAAIAALTCIARKRDSSPQREATRRPQKQREATRRRGVPKKSDGGFFDGDFQEQSEQSFGALPVHAHVKKKKNVADLRKKKPPWLSSKNVSRKSRKSRLRKNVLKLKRLLKKHASPPNVMQRLKQSVMQKKQHDKQNSLLLKNNGSLKFVPPKRKMPSSVAKQHHVLSKNFEHVLSVKVLALRMFKSP